MTNQNSQRVLLLEVDEAHREVLHSALQQAGCLVESAATPPDLLAKVQAEAFDLLLLANDLPDMAGVDLLRQVRQVQQEAARTHPPAPIILILPQEDHAAIETVLAAGASDYLPRPITPHLLRVRTGVWLRQRAARQQATEDHYELLQYERELQIGRQIQANFLPKDIPQPAGWQVSARFLPAREVAGDFYDTFMMTQNRRYAFVIADVCDKGVGSALFMALFRSLIRAFAQQNHSLSWADVLTNPASSAQQRFSKQRQAPPLIGTAALRNAVVLTNKYFIENHSDSRMFATLFFGVLDPVSGTLIYVNAGHNPPVLVGGGAIKAQLEPTGPAVGLMPGSDFTIDQVQFDTHDTLFCYTDGVIDARNQQGVAFSEEHMLALAQQPADSAGELLERFQTGLTQHIADMPQFDDITLLAVRRLPTEHTTDRHTADPRRAQGVLDKL